MTEYAEYAEYAETEPGLPGGVYPRALVGEGIG